MHSSVYATAGDAILARLPRLAKNAGALHYKRQPDVRERFGEAERGMGIPDAERHLTFLAEALRIEHPALFTQYAVWVKVLFHGLGLPEETLEFALKSISETLRLKLPLELSTAADEYIRPTLRHLPDFPFESSPFVSKQHPMGELATQYLAAILKGNRHEACALMEEAVTQGASVRDLYQLVYEPTLKEVGRLWQTGQISVAQEHFCTTTTQFVMSQLYPPPPAIPRKGVGVIVACVGGELHEFGARMVADLFELDGWDVCFLGANTPTRSILEALELWNAELLALSTTMIPHITLIRETIDAVRAQDPSVKILVGGYPFSIVSSLWREVGADGTAASASEALKVGTRLVGWKR